MRNSSVARAYKPKSGLHTAFGRNVVTWGTQFPKQAFIGLIFGIALLAFEAFNFDTTKYALTNLLGDVSFAGIGWATILAIAFCCIDFAGLAHLFTPEQGMAEEPKEVWFLMGAWLLGATMNALMTWWAVSLTLLEHPLGNEILNRGQLLEIVPIFVAVLVWLTRILFIGAFSVAGGHFFQRDTADTQLTRQRPRPVAKPTAPRPKPAAVRPKPATPRPRPAVPQPVGEASVPTHPPVRQSPPPSPARRPTRVPASMYAQGSRRR